MGEELGIRSAEPVEPISCTLGLMAHPLELAACPLDDIGVDPPESGTEVRLVEMAVAGDPAANARIVHLGQLGQGLIAAFVKRPTSNLSDDARQRLWTGGRLEAVREDRC